MRAMSASGNEMRRHRPPRRFARIRRPRGTFRALGALAVVLLVWAFVWEPSRLLERDYALVLPRWPAQCDGLRVDVVADLHTGSPFNGLDNLDRVVDRLVASDADLVLLAGDYVILSVMLGEYIPAERIAPRFARLAARKPVYAVLGNHDWWKDGGRVRRALEAAGVQVLENASTEVVVRDCRFGIAGIGDKWEGDPQPRRAFAALPEDLPTLALTHNPELFPDIPARAALTVAGHTHGGQLGIPWPGDPPLPTRVGGHYLAGHLVERGGHLFVSPGIGTSILPFRFGMPPEISRLRLRSEAVALEPASARATTAASRTAAHPPRTRP